MTQMDQHTRLVTSLALAVMWGASAGANPRFVDRFQPEPYQLDERFESNTLENYHAAGEVEWSEFKLTLQPKASVAIIKTLAPDLTLDFDLWPGEPAPGKPSVSQILIQTTNGYGVLVRIGRGLVKGRYARQATVAMLRPHPEGKGKQEVVPLPKLPVFALNGVRERWSFRYDNGLLSVSCNGNALGKVYVDAFSAWVTAIQFKQEAGEIDLSRLAVNGRTTGYTDRQRVMYDAINGMRSEANGHASKSNYLAAIELRKRIIKKAAEAYGEGDSSIALFLEDLSAAQAAIRLHEPALKNYERAVAILTDQLGSDHPETMLHRFVKAQHRITVEGLSSDSIYEMRDTILRYRRLAGANKDATLLIPYANVVRNEAIRQNAAGNAFDAKRLLNSAYSLIKEVYPSDHWQVKQWNNLLDLQERFVQSETGEHESLSKYFQLLEQHRLAIRAGNQLEAVLARSKLADHSRLIFQKNEPQAVDHLLANGSDLVSAGRIGEALAVLHEASELLAATPEGERSLSSEITCRIELGSAYSQLGRFQDSLDLFAKAEQLLDELGLDDKISWAVFHLQVGRHLLRYKYDDLALLHLAEAAKTFYSAQLYTSRGALESFELLGEAFRRTGKIKKAEQCAIELHYLVEATFGERCPAMIKVLKLEGNLLFDRRDYAAALEKHQQAYDLIVEFGRERDQATLEVLTGQIQTYMKQDDLPSAVECFEKKLAYELEYRESAFDAMSEEGQAFKSLQDLGSLDCLLILALEGHISAERAYSHALAYKGAVTARQRSLRVLLQSPEFKPLVDELSQIDLQLSVGAGSVETGGDAQNATALLRRRREIQTELTSANKKYRLASQRYDADGLKDSLPAGVALVDYVEYIKPQGFFDKLFGRIPRLGLAAFVITSDAEVQLYNLGAVDPAYEALVAWRTTMAAEPYYAAAGRGAEARTNLNGWGNELRKQVWDPMRDSLTGVSTVVISPSLHLSECPFAALPIGEADKETFLIEHYALASIATPRLLPELLLDDPKSPQGGLLIAGEIDYGAADAKRKEDNPILFQPLQHDKFEVLPIREAYSDTHPDSEVTYLSGGEATEARIRENATQHAWVHLSTHGFCQQVAIGPETQDGGKEEETQWVFTLSGVALAGGNVLPETSSDSENNGILLTEEIADLSLAQTELVTLSACETALGHPLAGEGMLGAQRALHIAGAKSSLTSLWAVNDASTSNLMVRFYDGLWRNEKPRAVALQQAMTQMIREHQWSVAEGKAYDSRTPPAMWAGFVLHGDWR